MATSQINYKQLWEKALSSDGRLSQCYQMFHNYSFNNLMWLWTQFDARKQETCPVATYKKWQDLGRQVKRGSKAFMMCMPGAKKYKDEKTGEEVVHSYFFDARKWFALSDTEGEDISIKMETPSFSLERILRNLEIKRIEFDRFDGNSQGYCRLTTGEIAISPVAEAPIKTALHEIAHSLLHRGEDQIHDERGIRECEAESTALLAGSALNVLTDKQKENSVGYIKHWMNQLEDMDKDKLIDRCARNVFGAVDKILKANQEIVHA